MLNCCILRKQTRNSAVRVQNESVMEISEDNSDDDDEFFECDEEVQVSDKKKSVPSWASAEGRVERIGELKLLEVS